MAHTFLSVSGAKTKSVADETYRGTEGTRVIIFENDKIGREEREAETEKYGVEFVEKGCGRAS